MQRLRSDRPQNGDESLPELERVRLYELEDAIDGHSESDPVWTGKP